MPQDPRDFPPARPNNTDNSPVQVDMQWASNTAVYAAYNMLGVAAADGWDYLIESVELEPLTVGPTTVLIYSVTCKVFRRASFFRGGGNYYFNFQVDAVSGKIVGYYRHEAR